MTPKQARWAAITVTAGALAITAALALQPPGHIGRALWPAAVALVAIATTRQATVGLALGILAGGLLLVGGDPIRAIRELLAAHLFPAVQGPWRIAAIGFTLVMGAFAGLLEHSGGFESLLRRILGDGQGGRRRLLLGVYGVGLLCFFDGLASAMLTGRLARPLVDRARIAREKLAWIVDSTSSPVACISLVSTWIATQLSLIVQGLQGAPFPLAPYELYLGSILANPYCLLTLLLIPLAIAWDYEPAAMRACRPVSMAPEESAATKPGRRRVVLVPLAVLSPAILLGFPLFCGTPVDMFSAAGWQTAFGGDGGPYALLVGSLLGLGAAWALFPRDRGIQPGEAASQGAGSLLPALLVLVLAWTLGSVLEALGASQQIAGWFSLAQSPFWLPLLVFVVGCGMSFVTGSSWGTMGLLTPLALSATLIAGKQAGLDPAALQTLSTMVIGAVFGGATFGDHCSPFSDTTIVSALASGCSTPAHVWTQLPFAALSAGCSLVAYSGMASGLAAWQATGLAAILMVLWLQAARTRAFTRT